MPSTLVVMALPAESNGVFEEAGIPVVYCGVGKVNAARALTRELARYAHAGQALPTVVNFGSAGSRRHDTGGFYACHRFVQRDMDVSGWASRSASRPTRTCPPAWSSSRRSRAWPRRFAAAGTRSRPVTCPSECGVLDMEAYALAKVCWFEGARFACVKYVTDGADHAAADAWQNNVHKAAEEFLRLYRELSGAPG